jgi:hypothetical protein
VSAPPLKVVLTDIGPHERFAFPLCREGITVSGSSGTGKSTLALALCWLFTGLDEHGIAPKKPDPVRDGADAGQAEFIAVNATTGDVTQHLLRRRTVAGTTSAKDGVATSTPAAITERFGRMFKFGTAEAAVFITSPVYWLELARQSGGRPLADLLTSVIPADSDPLAGLIADHEPNDAGRAEKWVTESKKESNTAAGRVQAATEALERYRLEVGPEQVDPEQVAAAQAAVDGFEGAMRANAAEQAARDAWTRAAVARTSYVTAFQRWKDREPPAPAAEQHDNAATFARLTAAGDRHADAVTRLAEAKAAAGQAKATLESIKPPQAKPALPPCAAKPGCALAAAALSTSADDFEESKAAASEALRLAGEAWDAAVADHRDAERELTAARTAHEAATRYLRALETFDRDTKAWQAGRPSEVPEPSEEPPAPTLPDVSAARALLATAAERQRAAEERAKRLEGLAATVAKEQTASDKAAANAARAKTVLDLLRSAPAKRLAAILSKLELGPVTIEPDGDGVAITLFGAPLHRASRGQIVAGGAWLRHAVKTAINHGGPCKLPIVVDEVESVSGLPWPPLTGAVWLRTVPGALSVEVCS